MTTALMDNGLFRAFNPSNGKALSLGKLYLYEPGTTTHRVGYQDKAQVATHAQPVILSALGEATVYLDGVYDLALYDANDVLVATFDDIEAALGETDVQTLVAAEVAASAAAYATRNVSASETLTTADAKTLIRVDASAGNITLTLPTAASMGGSAGPITFKRVDATSNTVTIQADGAELIDFANTIQLDNFYDTLAVRCNGLTWNVSTANFTRPGFFTDPATIGLQHFNSQSVITSTATVALTAAATLGRGFFTRILASGGKATIDPDGSETINGASTLVLYDGDSAEIFCDGSNWLAAVHRVDREANISLTLTNNLSETGGNSSVAHYHRRGRLVQVGMQFLTINISGWTASTSLTLTGFPFSADGSNVFWGNFQMNDFTPNAMATGRISGTDMTLLRPDGGAVVKGDFSPQTSISLNGHISYLTNDA